MLFSEIMPNFKPVFFAVFMASAYFTGTNALPQDVTVTCLAVCLTTKPVCPVGEAPSGGPGCWGCCRPICRRICPVATLSSSATISPPICLAAETLATTDTVGCWGCCKPLCGGKCLKERPQVCIAGYEVTGAEGCWSCCPITPDPTI